MSLENPFEMITEDLWDSFLASPRDLIAACNVTITLIVSFSLLSQRFLSTLILAKLAIRHSPSQNLVKQHQRIWARASVGERDNGEYLGTTMDQPFPPMQSTMLYTSP